MLAPQAIEKIKEMASEVSAREGCRVYDLEFVGAGGGRTLRLFIESEEGAVNVNQCANVSRGLSLMLDVEDVIPGGRYELEVSSPGLERPLRELWHFEKALGQPIRVRTNAGVVPNGTEPAAAKAGRKQVQGRLLKVEPNHIVLGDGKNEWEIDFSQIHRANVIFELVSEKHQKQKDKSGKGAKGKKKR